MLEKRARPIAYQILILVIIGKTHRIDDMTSCNVIDNFVILDANLTVSSDDTDGTTVKWHQLLSASNRNSTLDGWRK